MALCAVVIILGIITEPLCPVTEVGTWSSVVSACSGAGHPQGCLQPATKVCVGPGVGEVGARRRAGLVGQKFASDAPPVFIYWTAVLHCLFNHTYNYQN